MTDKLRAAALMAVDALDSDDPTIQTRAALSLRAALAEPEEKLLSVHRLDQWLKASLAEPTVKESLTVAEQKPVGQLQEGAYGRGQVLWFNKPADQSMLYTAPPRREAQERMHPEVKKMYEDYFDKCFRESSAQQRPWVGLTDEEITEIRLKMFDAVATNYEAYRAIEAKLKEKNSG
jgi:hypothetical protein